MQDIKCHNSSLGNDLRVSVSQMSHLHSVSVALYARVGSRFESPDDNGLSHFLEHMSFRGTERFRSSYDLNFAVEKLGATLHAETGRGHSLFQLTVAPDALNEALELLAEVIGRPLFREIDLEREIILEEISEDYDEAGKEICGEEIIRRLCFAGDPLAQRITGPTQNVERFTVADMHRHRENFYGARNLLLGIAGPVAPATARAAAARHLGALPEGRAAAAVLCRTPQQRPLAESVHTPGSQTDVHLAFHGVPETDPEYVAQHALLRVLDDGMSTRLHHRVCDQLGLAYSVGASIEPLNDVALIELEGTCAHGKVAELLRQFLGIMNELRTTLVQPEELEKIKVRYRRDIETMFDDPVAVAGWYAGTALYYEPSPLVERLAQIEAVTAEQIRAVANRIVDPQRVAVVAIGSPPRDLLDIVTSAL